MCYDDNYLSEEAGSWRGTLKGSAGISNTSLPLSDQTMGVGEGGCVWGELEVVKDKRRECRHGKGELGLVSTLFISLVGSGFREPRGSVGDRSPLTFDLQPAPGAEVFPHNVYLLHWVLISDSHPSFSDPIVYIPQ